jgi:hypothetical protein
LHTSLLRQSWADTDVFAKIKNILIYHGINKVYLYPSNIISCVDDISVQDAILKNIQQLSPVVAIHTDLNLIEDKPEKVILTTNQDPAEVKKALFSEADNNPMNIETEYYYMSFFNGDNSSNEFASDSGSVEEENNLERSYSI